MENLGEKIAALRKSKGMTQSELGDKLNVTAQAVSKWEKGLSEPDFQTAQKMCDLFGISMDEMLGRRSESPKATEKPTQPKQIVHTKIVNGYCESCKKPVGPGEYEVELVGRASVQHIYCKKCYAERRKSHALGAYESQKKETLRSLIFGAIAGVVALLIFLPFVGSVSIFLGYAAFACVTQIFWDGSVNDCFSFFIRGFKMPGVIFSLDLDGIIFLIVVKIGLSILSSLLSVVCFFIGLVVTTVYAACAFPFTALARKRETSDLKKTWESIVIPSANR